MADKLNIIAVTHEGAETVLAQEVNSLTGAIASQRHRHVLFSAEPAQVANFCYNSQSAIFVGLLFQNLAEHSSGTTCAVRWMPLVPSMQSREEVERTACESLDFGSLSVDLKTPDHVVYYVTSQDQQYYALDLIGFDLSKREYRVFCNKAALKGTIAFAVLQFAGYQSGKTLLNYCCKDGVIAIEAALAAHHISHLAYAQHKLIYPKLPVFKPLPHEILFPRGGVQHSLKKTDPSVASIHASDKEMRNLSASRKNAKIAGINQSLEFSRNDLEWLHMKYQEVDVLVAYLSTQEEPMLRLLCKQAYRIVKEAVVLVFNSKKALPREHILVQGKAHLYCYVFTREELKAVFTP